MADLLAASAGSRDGSTSLSLLQRLRRPEIDREAWELFYRVYGPLIYRHCRRKGLQPSDAENVMHDLFLKVREKIGEFERERTGSFRKYLAVVVTNKVNDFHKRLARSKEEGYGGIEEIADSAVEQEELSPQEVGRSLLEQLREHFKGNERTWRAFELRTVNEMATKDIAAELGMSEGNVNTAICRVKKRLREMRELLGEDEA